MPATFIVHTGAALVTREELATIPTPDSTPTWRPISHADLVHLITDRLTDAGYTIAREQYAVQAKGLWFFGALDLAGGRSQELMPVIDGESTLAIGFQHSNDKKMALRVVSGARITVCDNFALAGDREVFRNQHTHGVIGRLRESLGGYFGGLEAQAEKLRERFAFWQASVLSDVAAKAILYDGLHGGVIPHRIGHQIHENYFRAETLDYPDCKPRTAWGLHNACTRAFKSLNPGAMFEANIGLTQLLG